MKWISVKDELPEKIRYYLVFRKENARITSRLWRGNRWESAATITHWMPLPEPPKE